MEIKLQFIQSYSNESLQKFFYPHQILEQYKNNNNKKKAQLKQYIQHLFQQALKHKIIQNKLQIKFKNKKKKTQFIEIQELTPLLIGQSQVIRFYEQLF